MLVCASAWPWIWMPSILAWGQDAAIRVSDEEVRTMRRQLRRFGPFQARAFTGWWRMPFSAAFWARFILGKNWSATVTIKQDHQLIVRGPYQIVRHPIYTGLLAGLFGTALIYGLMRCFVGVVVVGLGLWLKAQTEEQFMLQRFGAQYALYRQQVRALIPFVL